MKIRTGFVSNSSSISFMCHVCGNIESDWDLCLEDAYMFVCKNGHTVCDSHVYKELKDKLDDRYSTPIEFCPICNLDTLSNDLVLNYLLKESGLTKKEIEQKVKDRFGSYKLFEEYLKGA